MVAWLLRQLQALRTHANDLSEIPLGRWWIVALSAITPFVLGVQMFLNFQTNLTSNYEGYPTAFLVIAGWGVAAVALVAGLVLSLPSWNTDKVERSEAP